MPRVQPRTHTDLCLHLELSEAREAYLTFVGPVSLAKRCVDQKGDRPERRHRNRWGDGAVGKVLDKQEHLSGDSQHPLQILAQWWAWNPALGGRDGRTSGAYWPGSVAGLLSSKFREALSCRGGGGEKRRWRDIEEGT